MEKNNLVILHYIRTLSIGGEQVYLLRLLHHLKDFSFKHIVLYSIDGSLKKEFPDFVTFIKTGIELVNPKTILVSPFIFKNFREILKKNNVNVVSTYAFGLLASILHLSAKSFNIPVIHTIQRAFGISQKFEKITVKIPPLRWISYSLIDVFVALGDYYKVDHIKNFKIPENKIRLCYNGINLEEYNCDENLREDFRKDFNFNSSSILFGFVGRLVNVKGFLKCFSLFEVLVKNYNENIGLIVVGDGAERPKYERVVEENGLKDKIHFLGWRRDIVRIMNGFDIYVQATDNPLNGISSIEAMGCGKPIITIVRNEEEKLMAAETCIEGVNGFLININSLTKEAEKLSLLIKDKEMMKKMGMKSRKIAESKFDIKKHAYSITSLYRELDRKRNDL